MRPTLIPLLFCLFASVPLSAQQLPTSNIFLFDMEQKSDSVFLFSKPKYLTAFNKDGYNNQPFFMNDEELYITVQMADDTTQTDIYALNIKKGIKTQVTATVESEYSATYKNDLGLDRPAEFTCIRVEADENNTQRLWRFPLDRNNNGKPVFEEIEDIGYHAWPKANWAALFIVDAPHRLVLASEQTGITSNITTNVGRCLQKMANGFLLYVHKLSADNWLIKMLNTANRRSELLTPTLPGAEDFAILNNGTILMAKGSKLYKFHRTKDIDWKEIADFSSYGIQNISRLAVRDGKYLALVEN